MKFCATFLLVIFMITTESLADEQIPSVQACSIVQTCFKLFRTSSEVQEKFTKVQFRDDDGEDVTCVIRCGGIVSGMYDDESGWSVEKVVRQAEGKIGVEGYRKALEECYGTVQPEQYGDDLCKKSFLLFRCGMKAWDEHIKDVE